MSATNHMPLRMRIVWDVLEYAKQVDDDTVTTACRKLITLNRIGEWDHKAFATVIDADRQLEELREEYAD
jgi:hypothetical protein